MRADRLLAALMPLQAPGRMTAAGLDAEVEASVVTAGCDLVALSAAGVPVYAQPGRGRDWALVAGARTDPNGLDVPRSPGILRARRPGGSRLAGRAGRAAQARPCAAADVPRRRGGRCGRHRRRSQPWAERERHRSALADLLQDAVVRRRRVRIADTGGQAAQPPEVRQRRARIGAELVERNEPSAAGGAS